MHFSLSRRSGLLIPAMSTRFFDDVAPDWILSTVKGTLSLSDNNEMIARFAFPPVAGAVTRQPMVFRHLLYSAGKESVLAPAVISRAMIVPHRSSKRASDISGMRDPYGKECCPALTHLDHQWHAAVLHLCLNPAGRCLSRIRVVPWITYRRLSINHPGTYGCAVSAVSILFFAI